MDALTNLFDNFVQYKKCSYRAEVTGVDITPFKGTDGIGRVFVTVNLRVHEIS